MLGAYYNHRERELQLGALSQSDYADYACELLGEILTRGLMLDVLYRRCLDHVPGHVDEREALEHLAAAVEVFAFDMKELAERGKRAGLLVGGSFGSLDGVSMADGSLAPMALEVAK